MSEFVQDADVSRIVHSTSMSMSMSIFAMFKVNK